MKIVNRIEFLKLPSGTLFCQCREKWAWRDIHVKFDSLIHSEDGDGDFVSMDFTNIPSHDSGDLSDRWDDMLDNGASYPLDLEDSAGRDGYFDRQAMFMVFENDDVIKLRDFIAGLVT